jgi:hypothetical protein
MLIVTNLQYCIKDRVVDMKKALTGKKFEQVKNKDFFISIIILLFLCASNTSLANAQCTCTPPAEKPLIIKGLSIGMDVYDARKVMEQFLSKDWKISPVGVTDKLTDNYRFAGGDREIFGSLPKDNVLKPSIVGDWGFAVQVNSSDEPYHGYVSADKGNNKVTRISFGGKLTNSIFSSTKIEAEDFVKQFAEHYNMPEFNWIAFGWQYPSPKGYIVNITTDKLIDIRKETVKEPVKKPKIQFDL